MKTLTVVTVGLTFVAPKNEGDSVRVFDIRNGIVHWSYVNYPSCTNNLPMADFVAKYKDYIK